MLEEDNGPEGISYGFGFDPGINHGAWALVGSDGSVRFGLIENLLAKELKLKGWPKMESLLESLNVAFRDGAVGWPEGLECWVCEAQYPGRGNPDHQTRNGWISAAVHTLAPEGVTRKVAVPATWTRGEAKEFRHEKLRQRLPPESEWVQIALPAGRQIPPTKKQWEDIRDAVGLAIWGLEQEEIEMEI